MSWNDVLIYIVECVAGLIITVAIPYVFVLLRNKIKNQQAEKYINIAGDIINDCVLMIKQTFVDTLKANGKFDSDAQAKAFEMCKNEILGMLNEKAKAVIIDMYGDLESYLKIAIERNVAITKM